MHDSRTHANVTGLAIPQLASFLIFSFSRLLLISSTLPTPSNHMALFPPPPAVLVLITVPSPKHVVFTLFFRTYTNVTFHLDFVLIYRQAHTPLPLSAIFLALSFVLRGIFSPCNMLSTYFIFFCTFWAFFWTCFRLPFEFVKYSSRSVTPLQSCIINNRFPVLTLTPVTIASHLNFIYLKICLIHSIQI